VRTNRLCIAAIGRLCARGAEGEGILSLPVSADLLANRYSLFLLFRVCCLAATQQISSVSPPPSSAAASTPAVHSVVHPSRRLPPSLRLLPSQNQRETRDQRTNAFPPHLCTAHRSAWTTDETTQACALPAKVSESVAVGAAVASATPNHLAASISIRE
jgi:hypothetical protein